MSKQISKHDITARVVMVEAAPPMRSRTVFAIALVVLLVSLLAGNLSAQTPVAPGNLEIVNSGPVSLRDGSVILRRQESADGKDLNDDGDALDAVLHAVKL